MEVTEKQIIDDYNKLKICISTYINKKKFSDACTLIRRAAQLMYSTNLIYYDNYLEEALHTIGREIICEKGAPSSCIGKNNRVVFYDYFVLDNRGLTEQYLNALANSNHEILFIGNFNDCSKEIITKLNSNNIKKVMVPKLNDIDTTQFLYETINQFSPSIIISHTAPWDVCGLMCQIPFKDPCKKFLINITDHAFWIGKTFFDFFFEFRDYGFNISRDYREIEESRLLKLPYYPIINKNIPFSGFDFPYQGKKIIFSGGSTYKISGSNKFFEIAKHILDKHEDTIFLFLGNGDSCDINNFIIKNKYQNRFFFRNERKDIFEVFKHCYLYINTYPLIGGLMTQYACVAGKLPMTLNDEHDPCNDIYELMNEHFNINLQFKNIDELNAEVDNYIEHPDLLFDQSKKIANAIMSESYFNELLLYYLDNPTNKLPVTKYHIDINKFAQTYISRYNSNLYTYYHTLLQRDFKLLLIFKKHILKYAILIGKKLLRII
ncbi:MAG: hypothetical protein MJ069_03390 [Salinivirgaceae bacterium]|nr:hypothetical protein [Salinivirgaceae bacterium]